MRSLKPIKYICGIDTLFYFAQTDERYEKIYSSIEEQLEAQKALHESDKYAYKHCSMLISLGDTPLKYLNKKDGVHWFRELNSYFKIGFKDPSIKNYHHNIQIQLQGIGIYTIGVSALLDFINHALLQGYTTGLYQISRADLNCFIQYDFGFLSKEMFVSKKKGYHIISEFGNSKRIQTLYVGQKPFRLRLYDKKVELKTSDKDEIMQEYFKHHGFVMDEPIFNIEFEMHRAHFKSFNIKSLDEFLSHATSLFQKAMDDIRLIDLSTITQKDILNNSKNRAKSLPIWEYVKKSYTLTSFLQKETTLERVPQKRYVYDMPKFINDIHELLSKALMSKLSITSDLMSKVTDYALDAMEDNKLIHITQEDKAHTKRIHVYVQNLVGELVKRYEILEDGRLIEWKDVA